MVCTAWRIAANSIIACRDTKIARPQTRSVRRMTQLTVPFPNVLCSRFAQIGPFPALRTLDLPSASVCPPSPMYTSKHRPSPAHSHEPPPQYLTPFTRDYKEPPSPPPRDGSTVRSPSPHLPTNERSHSPTGAAPTIELLPSSTNHTQPPAPPTMAFDAYPYSPRLPLAYPDDLDYGAYAPAYDRSSYRPSVRAPYLPRPAPLHHSSYDAAAYRGYDAYAGGRSSG